MILDMFYNLKNYIILYVLVVQNEISSIKTLFFSSAKFMFVCFFFLLGSLKHHKGHIVQDFGEKSFIFVDTSKRTMVSRPSAQAAWEQSSVQMAWKVI